MIYVKSVADPPSRDDGERVLVDADLPRGIGTSDARLDLWMKEIAPSPHLIQWFAGDPDKWDDFAALYEIELDGKKDLLKRLSEDARKGPVTLLHSAPDLAHNNAVVLKEILEAE